MKDLLILTEEGLYCPVGDFYIDPWKPVPLALITHGHSDHLRQGHKKYVVSVLSKLIVQNKIGLQSKIETVPFGEKIKIGQTWVSFHPAGHILGSSQIRVEYGSEIWVASGDYKRNTDASCDPFEVIPCSTFITEATFGLPIYHWPDPKDISQKIMEWWNRNAEEGYTSLLFGYSLGKSQRILSMLSSWTDKTVYVHGALTAFNDIYQRSGIKLAPTLNVLEKEPAYHFSKDLILAPPSAFRSPWMKRFPKVRTANASGWMMVRGNRRWRGFDQGFILSDHADWQELLTTIAQTKAERILVTHGFTDSLSRYLREKKINASSLGGQLFEVQDEVS